MKKLYLFILALFATLAAVAANEGSGAFTASDVLVRMPAHTLDILTTSQRKDMLDYYKADSIRNVMNVMEGLSHLNPPVTDQYLQVQVTPVTKFTVKILPYSKNRIAMTIYTVGDSLQAHDSEIRFYDENLQELKRDKFIKLVSTSDFFDFKGVDGKLKKELQEMVPFPTVEYTVSPEGDTMKAELTVGAFLGKEVLDKITPYLHRTREYRWNGRKWELLH